MIADKIQVGGIIPINFEGHKVWGYRIPAREAARRIGGAVPLGYVYVQFQHKRTLRLKVARVPLHTEVEFDPHSDELNPWRQLN